MAEALLKHTIPRKEKLEICLLKGVGGKSVRVDYSGPSYIYAVNYSMLKIAHKDASLTEMSID